MKCIELNDTCISEMSLPDGVYIWSNGVVAWFHWINSFCCLIVAECNHGSS